MIVIIVTLSMPISTLLFALLWGMIPFSAQIAFAMIQWEKLFKIRLPISICYWKFAIFRGCPKLGTPTDIILLIFIQIDDFGG